jgi:hypothetical protein
MGEFNMAKRKQVKHLDVLDLNAVLHDVRAELLKKDIVNYMTRLRPTLDRNLVDHLRALQKAVDRIKYAKKLTQRQVDKIYKILEKKPRKKLAKTIPALRKDAKPALAKRMIRSTVRNLRFVTKCPDELDMMQMFLMDAADHLDIGCLLKEGQFDKAGRLAGDLDTASREEIPATVWNALTADFW